MKLQRPYSGQPWDWRHFQVDRRSGLPLGYFNDRSHADLYVLIVCVLALVIGLYVTL